MVVNRVIDNAAVAIAAINRAPVANARTQALAHPRGVVAQASCLCVPESITRGQTETHGRDARATPWRRDAVWRAQRAAIRLRVGGVGQWCRRARIGHARHISRGGLFASRRQHSAAARRGAAMRLHRRAVTARHHRRLRNSDGPRARDLPARAQKGPHRAPLPVCRRRASARCSASTRTRFIRQFNRRCMSVSPRGNRAKAKFRAGKPTRPRTRASSRLKPWIARCAARKVRRRFTRARTASSRGCSAARARATTCPLPAPGEPCRAILDSYTKEHSAEYQAQAWIDLAFRLRGKIPDLKSIREMIDSHEPSHARVIGTRRERPAEIRSARQPRDARSQPHVHFRRRAAHRLLASRQKLRARSRASILTSSRSGKKSRREEDAEWTRRYHSTDPKEKAFGGRVEIMFTDGEKLTDEIAVADAHPLGARPFVRAELHPQISNAYGGFDCAVRKASGSSRPRSVWVN